MRNMAFAANW